MTQASLEDGCFSCNLNWILGAFVMSNELICDYGVYNDLICTRSAPTFFGEASVFTS